MEPGRLEEVEERPNRLYSLETKHHAANSDELIALRDRLGEQLGALTDSDNVLATPRNRGEACQEACRGACHRALSEKRASAGAEFSAELRRQASTLGMPNLRCEISLTRGQAHPDGFDQVQFLSPLTRTILLCHSASCFRRREVSRLMLTVRTILTERMHLPSIIFDEVDTGVSGDVAGRMARMMAA